VRPGETRIEVEGSDLSGLDNEPGGHRIQRVPPTERKGRVHTSTVTVAVLEDHVISTNINEQDIRIEWFSGTGAGGQYRNKHQNSCRIVHVPTGLTVTAQCRERSNSLKQARQELERRLKENEARSVANKVSGIRKTQMGSGMRGDKIRTYRFQDDRVVDHITGKSASCERVLKGHFELLWR
jgi:peptide chain release factor 1